MKLGDFLIIRNRSTYFTNLEEYKSYKSPIEHLMIKGYYMQRKSNGFRLLWL